MVQHVRTIRILFCRFIATNVASNVPLVISMQTALEPFLFRNTPIVEIGHLVEKAERDYG